MSNRLEGRTALITGASRGIGRAVAKRFAQEGAHVILVARTVGGLEEVDDEIRKYGEGATLVPFDLQDFDAIDRLGASVAERWGKLDILVGNAGILGDLSPIGHIDPDVWDQLMTINVSANWRLIRSFDTLLRASSAGRAIFVTSGVANMSRPYWGGYAVTKAALDCLVQTWAREVEKTKIRVNLISPGPTATDMRAKGMPGEDPETLPKPDDVAALFVELASVTCEISGQIVRFREWVKTQ